MSANRRKRPDIIDCVQYTCNNYGRYGNVMCTAHAIEARDLFNAVLADINRFADMAVNDERAVRAIEEGRVGDTSTNQAKSMHSTIQRHYYLHKNKGMPDCSNILLRRFYHGRTSGGRSILVRQWVFGLSLCTCCFLLFCFMTMRLLNNQ